MPAPVNAGADAAKPDAKPPGANIVKVPDDEYVKSGFPADELVGEGVMWNDVQNGLSVGYRITGDEWRILGKEVKVELWVQNPGDKDVKFQSLARPDIGLRMKLKDETGVTGAKEFEHESNIVPNDRPPFGELRLLPAGHALKVKEFTVSLLWPENDVSGIKGHYFAIDPGAYNFRCELDLPGFSATGEGGKQLTPAAGEWTGKLTTRSHYIAVIAPDAPAPKPRIEQMDVDISKDGEVSLFRKKMPLEELKTRAARNAKKWFTIRADEDVPYAKVVEVVEALKAVGVTEFSFSEARMGDGKYRVANRQANYKFDDMHHFSMCRPGEHPQFFTVRWPVVGERPACWVRTYPNVSGPTQGKWAVVWEPGTDVLWWVDDTDVGKMTLTDPARVIVDREGRMGRFSASFGFPEAVQIEFRRLGLVVGQIGQIGGDADGNPSSREVLTAETVDEKGVGMSERPTVHPHDEFTDEWMSLAQEVADARGLESREMDALIAWGEEDDGIRSGMLMMNRAKVGEQLKTRVVIRNVSSETKVLKLSPVLNRMDAMARTPEGKQLTVRKVVLFGTDPVFSYTLKPGEQLEFPGPPIQFGLEHDTDGNIKTPEWPVCGVEAGPGSLHLKMSLINVRAPDTGELEMDIANR